MLHFMVFKNRRAKACIRTKSSVCNSSKAELFSLIYTQIVPGIYQRDQRLTWISKSLPKAA